VTSTEAPVRSGKATPPPWGAAGSRPTDEAATPRAIGVTLSLGRRERQSVKYERVVFLSDAVFAIALTLLVLDLRSPAGLSGATADAELRRLIQIPGPVFAFTIGFFVLAAYWTGHREIFGAVRRMNGRIVWLNFAFLFWIALQPFATSLIGSHDPTALSVAAYAIVQMATGTAQALLWTYATSHPSIARPLVDPQFQRWITIELMRVPIVGLVSLPIAAAAGAVPAMLSWLLVVPLTLIVHHHFRTQVGETPDD
jgi:uncharacterized membrane protein